METTRGPGPAKAHLGGRAPQRLPAKEPQMRPAHSHRETAQGPPTCGLVGALSGSLLPLGLSVHRPWVSVLGPERPVRPRHLLSGGGPETRLATGARSDSPSPRVTSSHFCPQRRPGPKSRLLPLGWAGLGPSGAGGRRFWEPLDQDPDWSPALTRLPGRAVWDPGQNKGPGPSLWGGKSRPAVNRGWPSSLWSERLQSHPPGRFRAAGK